MLVEVIKASITFLCQLLSKINTLKERITKTKEKNLGKWPEFRLTELEQTIK